MVTLDQREAQELVAPITSCLSASGRRNWVPQSRDRVMKLDVMGIPFEREEWNSERLETQRTEGTGAAYVNPVKIASQ